MGDPIYVSNSQIEKVRGVHRKAHLEAGGIVEFGVHGSIKEHYKLQHEGDLPLPVDYVVAATGG